MKPQLWFALPFMFLGLLCGAAAGDGQIKQLNEYIHEYEDIEIDQNYVREQHHRMRRSPDDVVVFPEMVLFRRWPSTSMRLGSNLT